MEYKRFTEKVDSGFVSELDCRIAYNKLCGLEDKIEQGKIVELPFKVGDAVYIACDWDINKVVEGVVSEVEYSVNKNGDFLRIYVDHEYIYSKKNPNVVQYRYIFFPNEVFSTRNEAENRLKELRK